MKNHFGWEYKGKHRDLKAAYTQLQQYREALENPPLLVVCDLDRFEIHTNFTGTITRVFAFDLDGLAQPANLEVLRKLFTEPEALKPGQTTEALTKQAAELIGQVADGMWQRGIPAHDAAHFLMKLIFCMFAEDIGLLPNKVFTKALAAAKKTPDRLARGEDLRSAPDSRAAHDLHARRLIVQMMSMLHSSPLAPCGRGVGGEGLWCRRARIGAVTLRRGRSGGSFALPILQHAAKTTSLSSRCRRTSLRVVSTRVENRSRTPLETQDNRSWLVQILRSGSEWTFGLTADTG
jgi:hypothetical protein